MRGSILPHEGGHTTKRRILLKLAAASLFAPGLALGQSRSPRVGYLFSFTRLEGEHLAALAHCGFDFCERRAATRRDDELRGLVGDDAGIAASVEHFAFERLAVEVLGAAAAQAQRRLPRCGPAD